MPNRTLPMVPFCYIGTTMTMLTAYAASRAASTSAFRGSHSRFSTRSTFCNGILTSTSTPSGALKSSLDPSSIPYEKSSSIFDPFRNLNNVNDLVVSALSPCGGCKVTACTARNIMNELINAHSMTPVPSDVMGRLSVCALLMSNGMQLDQTLQISIDGDGPLRGAMAVSTGGGEVRGYVGNPSINGFTIHEAVGKGTVQVVKNHPSWPNPYNGITVMRNGDIDRDVGIYLAESEQRSCALAAATVVNEVGLCKAAGGYLVERLPGCSEETIRQVEKNLAKLVQEDKSEKLPTNLLLQGVTPLDLVFRILDGMGDGVIPLGQVSPTMKCNCSEERLFRSLRLLPRAEVDEIIAKHDQIEARCHFCGKVYRMGPEEVQHRFAIAKGDPSKDVDL